jgi:hypothetical protein
MERCSAVSRADGELADHFMAAVGVHAQSYEPSVGGAFDPQRTDDALLFQIQNGTMSRYDATAATLAALPYESRRVLRLVYEPHGWPVWLASALAPSWGNGSFVGLGATTARAVAGFSRRRPDAVVTPGCVLAWFCELGRGGEGEFLKGVRTDCEALRTEALKAFWGARCRQRVEARRAEAGRVKHREQALVRELKGRGLRCDVL